MNVQKDFSLLPFNTFGIDVYVRYYTEIHQVGQLQQLIENPFYQHFPWLILGGGSNILFTKNFEGLVVRNTIVGIEKVDENEDSVTIKVGGGVEWNELVNYTVDQGWQGLENLALIPGTVGAAPIQNIGAYGVEQNRFFVALESVRLSDGELTTFTKDECNFGYRNSVFKTFLKGKYAIVNVTYCLNKKPVFNTNYGSLAQQLQNEIEEDTLTVASIRDAVVAIRQNKLPDPAQLGNCGSFFKNPEIEIEQFRQLQEKFPKIVGYPTHPGLMKVPAGWLIEQCGWKGKHLGNVGTYEKQALVLVNRGNASGEEAHQLSGRIQKDVEKQFGIRLEPEVNIL